MSKEALQILKSRGLAPGIHKCHWELFSTVVSGRKQSDIVFVRKGECAVRILTTLPSSSFCPREEDPILGSAPVVDQLPAGLHASCPELAHLVGSSNH